MAREIFLDCGAWVALIEVRDAYHTAATDFYNRGLKQWSGWVTTNLMIAEAYILIRRRASHTLALQFLTTMRATPNLIIVYSTAELEIQAEAILRRYADHDFSYTDAVSFAVMRQRGITEAFSFDHHFLTAGFVLLPASH